MQYQYADVRVYDKDADMTDVPSPSLHASTTPPLNDCTILERRGIGGPSVSHGDLTDRMPVNTTSAMGLHLARREAAAAAAASGRTRC